jgi:hypothetical protein
MRTPVVLSAVIAIALAAVVAVSPAGAGRPAFNPVCLGTKIEGGESGTYAMAYGAASGSITIAVEETALGPVFSFDTGDPQHVVGQVDVKGGTSIVSYAFGDGVTFADGLHAGVNPVNGEFYGISYLCFHTGFVDGGGEE